MTWLLDDYNTRVVVIGTTLLGTVSGVIGSFMLLRRRALMGDALSHATLPGICVAFIIMALGGGTGRSLVGLLIGAAISGTLGMLTILAIRNLTRIKEDAALGIVLSVYFGAGAALLGVVRQIEGGYAAGLEGFIYGKTASMVALDAWLIAAVCLVCCATAVLLFKELRLLCFDESFAASIGYPVQILDLTLTALVILVTIIGLQAVGLVLMIALLVTPAAAARFWTRSMAPMTVWAGCLGAVSGAVGSTASALYPKLPSGATIVVVAAFFFLISMFVGVERGVWTRWRRRQELNVTVDRQHVLRAVFELVEASQRRRGGESAAAGAPGAAEATPTASVSWEALLAHRAWTPRRLRKSVRAVQRRGELVVEPDGSLRLTAAGQREAARLAHEHRLWELYLITHADVAPSQVDRGADTIEHVLDAEMIDELERLLRGRTPESEVARSPHPIVAHAGAAQPGSGNAEK